MQTDSEPKPKFKLTYDRDHPLSEPSKFRHLPLVILVLLVLNLLVTCHNSTTSQRGASNRPYIYVQSPEGTTVRAKPADPLYRSDATVATFVENWLKLAFTWKALPEKEKAFVKEGTVDYPYQFHAASVAIVPGYREAYMKRVAQKYQKNFPLANYIGNRTQSYVRTFQEPKVVEVEKGVWDVTVVATRTHASDKSILAHEVFNHVIRVRAVPPSGRDRKLWGDSDTYLGKLMNEMQLQGLQIVEIVEF